MRQCYTSVTPLDVRWLLVVYSNGLLMRLMLNLCESSLSIRKWWRGLLNACRDVQVCSVAIQYHHIFQGLIALNQRKKTKTLVHVKEDSCVEKIPAVVSPATLFSLLIPEVWWEVKPPEMCGILMTKYETHTQILSTNRENTVSSNVHL